MTAGEPHHLGSDVVHTFWDRDLPPRLTIAPGDTVTFQTREPSNGQMTRDIVAGVRSTQSCPPDLAALIAASVTPQPEPSDNTALPGHALTGPVAIAGAEPGDTLAVEVISVIPAAWGWTASGPGPGGGLLQDDWDAWILHAWDLRNGRTAIFAPGIEVPLAPFCGVMGVAPAEPGRHSTIPPRSAGGNLDVRQLTAGSTLLLPVQVPGALFSCGDAHAAQGDGEVSGTGIEADATVTLRFDLLKGQSIPGPQFHTPMVDERRGPWFAAIGTGPDLYVAAQEALRGVLTYLEHQHGLPRQRAGILASACVDLRLSQLVNGGVFTVSAFLPLSIFTDTPAN
ncbi:MAG: acetamidase/formamidase family protein [Thermomicrobiales bacterium]